MKRQGAESGVAGFDAVSLEQRLRFRALPPREKIRALEGMADLVDHMHAQRRAQGLPVIEPESRKRK